MSIQETLQKQAAAVKANAEKLTQAQQLEAMAAQLRVEATAPVKLNFKELARQRREKAFKMADLIHANRQTPAVSAQPVTNVKPATTNFKTAQTKKENPADTLKRIKAVFDQIAEK